MGLYRPVKIASLELPGNLLLAPVAGYTDRAFRGLCAEEGAVLAFTELVSAEALSRNPGRYGLGAVGEGVAAAANLLRRAVGEGRYAVQLFGSDPGAVYRAVRLLSPLKPDAVDINSGCPVAKVVKTGAGAALMRDPANLARVVAQAVKASEEALGGVPVTVKIRSGWDSSSLNYREAAVAAVEAGAAMISLHPRTRAQGYGGKSDWSCIAGLASRLPVPVTGSGDIFCPEDAERMLRETGSAALMFARGALGNPFIFSSTRALLLDAAYTAPSPEARVSAGLRHLVMLAEDIGEAAACREMRKQFCAYTRGSSGRPGLSGAGRLRNQLVHAETIAQYREILQGVSSGSVLQEGAHYGVYRHQGHQLRLGSGARTDRGGLC